MAVEAAGHHRGLCGHWGLGTQPSVQVDSHTHTDIWRLFLVVRFNVALLFHEGVNQDALFFENRFCFCQCEVSF